MKDQKVKRSQIALIKKKRWIEKSYNHYFHNNAPLLSIIVPVYNVEKYINRCVDSILNQNYKNLEIILVDDGSTDDCGIICDKYALSDKRVKVIHKANGGLSSARNVGIDNSTGEYIGFVDSDDWIEPEMYSVLLGNMLNENADVSDVNARIVTDEKSFKNKRQFIKVLDGNEIILDYFISDKCAVWRKLYSKEVIGNTRFPEGKTNEDICTNYIFLTKARRIVKSNLVMYHYFSNPQSITGEHFRKRDFDLIEACDTLYDLAKNNEDIVYYATVKKALARYGLLGRYIMYECDEIPDLEDKIRKLYYELKDNIYLLIGSYISPKRKALIACIFFMNPLNMKKIVSIIKKRKKNEKYSDS